VKPVDPIAAGLTTAVVHTLFADKVVVDTAVKGIAPGEADTALAEVGIALVRVDTVPVKADTAAPADIAAEDKGLERTTVPGRNRI
jgi:hypothetical protein